MLDETALRAHTVEIARRIRRDEEESTAAVTNAIVATLDRLDADATLHDMLDASVHGNVTTIIHIMANGIPTRNLQPTTAAVEYALRLAQREVPATSLVRAYHIGQNVLLRYVYRQIDDLGLDTADAMQFTGHISDILADYIDWITSYVFQAYEDERRRWLGVESHVLTSAILAVLESPEPDPGPLERETGYRTDQQHLAVILFSTGDAVTVRDLHRTAQTLAASLRCEGAPLIAAIDRQTVWAWLPLGTRPRRISTDAVARATAPSDAVRIAVGLVGDGLPGFIRSHRQARLAHTVAAGAGTRSDAGSPATGPVTGYADRGVAVTGMLSQDPAATRAWVHDTLGPVAGPGETNEVLRETLHAFHAAGDSHVRAAEALNVHRNTVKYRVNKALSEMPDRDRMDRALALTVFRLLGEAMLSGD
jgi:DNA-binding PucR family transcriptional regulator